jgi:hypothetical protein
MSRRKATVPVCRAPVPAPALSPEELAEIDASIALSEVPDCKCRPPKVRSCELFYGAQGCPDRRRPCCITRAHPDGCARLAGEGHCDHGPCNRCECGLIPPPCEHVLAATNDLTIGEWIEMLERRDPLVYTSPPPVRTSAEVLSRDVVVRIYEGRAARGVGLFHKDDLWRKDADDEPGVARLGQRGPNGATTVYDEDDLLVREELICEGVL